MTRRDERPYAAGRATCCAYSISAAAGSAIGHRPIYSVTPYFAQSYAAGLGPKCLLNLYVTPMQRLRLFAAIHQDSDGVTEFGSAGYDACKAFEFAAFLA